MWWTLSLIAINNAINNANSNKLRQQLYQPLQNIAVDERMVKSRNRSGIRQFMKDKPTKWGINLWVATDSSNGYTCDFEIYTGKKSRDSSQHGLGYDVVM